MDWCSTGRYHRAWCCPKEISPSLSLKWLECSATAYTVLFHPYEWRKVHTRISQLTPHAIGSSNVHTTRNYVHNTGIIVYQRTQQRSHSIEVRLCSVKISINTDFVCLAKCLLCRQQNKSASRHKQPFRVSTYSHSHNTISNKRNVSSVSSVCDIYFVRV